MNLTPREVSKLPPYAILGAVRTHEVSFPRPVWAAVSPEARQLVAAMLERDPAARISAPDALAHPWLARALGAVPEATGLARERERAVANAVEFSARVAALHL
jgi:serine/threonine protein kinase